MMLITIIKNGEPLGTPIESNAESLSDIKFMSMDQSLNDFINKDSVAYDVWLDDSFLDRQKIITGVPYRYILDSETPSFSAYNTNFRRIAFRVTENDGKYYLESNNSRVLKLEVKEIDVRCKIDNLFNDCIHSTKELLLVVVGKKDKDDEGWKKTYGEILHKELDDKALKEKDGKGNYANGILKFWSDNESLEFSNFEHYAKYKRSESTDKKTSTTWFRVEQYCSELKPYRNTKSHDRQETINLGKKNIDKAVSNMKELANIFDGESKMIETVYGSKGDLWEKLDGIQSEIKILFDKLI